MFDSFGKIAKAFEVLLQNRFVGTSLEEKAKLKLGDASAWDFSPG